MFWSNILKTGMDTILSMLVYKLSFLLHLWVQTGYLKNILLNIEKNCSYLKTARMDANNLRETKFPPPHAHFFPKSFIFRTLPEIPSPPPCSSRGPPQVHQICSWFMVSMSSLFPSTTWAAESTPPESSKLSLPSPTNQPLQHQPESLEPFELWAPLTRVLVVELRRHNELKGSLSPFILPHLHLPSQHSLSLLGTVW